MNEAHLYGPYLHAADGTGPGAYVRNPVAASGRNGFMAQENSNSGGMNVRFNGNWKRFRPAATR